MSILPFKTELAKDQRKEAAIEDAIVAFWNKMAEHYPEILHGDVAPIDHAKFTLMVREMATRWIHTNSPKNT